MRECFNLGSGGCHGESGVCKVVLKIKFPELWVKASVRVGSVCEALLELEFQIHTNMTHKGGFDFPFRASGVLWLRAVVLMQFLW